MENMFFKVFLSSHCYQKLDICLTFVSRNRGHLPDRAVLRNSFGQSWEVRVTKVGSVFSFTEGWSKFVDDNNIQDGEFLVFSYNGESEFSVTVYGHNGCNKETESDGESNDETDDKKGKRAAKTEAETSDDEEEEVFKYGIIARPKNPYFVSKLRENRKNSMHIPVDVIRDHKLAIPSNIVILDEENKEWESEVKVWADGRTWITSGFKAFKKWNELKKEDRCLCEFVDSGFRGLVLKIRILRKGSWLPV